MTLLAAFLGGLIGAMVAILTLLSIAIRDDE